MTRVTPGATTRRSPARRIGAVAVTIGLACTGAALDASPVAAAGVVTALYEMNQANGSTLVDSGPNGVNGTVGSLVTVGATYNGSTGLRFPPAIPDVTPANDERLALVPSNDALNFGTAPFAIEFRYRTTRSFGNVVQKGQNHTRGGYFKFEQPKGFMTCLVKGSNGEQRAVKSPIATNDGQWHTIRCERSATGIRLFVDGAQVRFLRGSTGSVSNTWPLSIGGKWDCDQVTVTCDYFQGDIDYVKIEKG